MPTRFCRAVWARSILRRSRAAKAESAYQQPWVRRDGAHAGPRGLISREPPGTSAIRQTTP